MLLTIRYVSFILCGARRGRSLPKPQTSNPYTSMEKAKTCFLLMACHVDHSYGYEHGVYLDEVEAVSEMWRLACERSRACGLLPSSIARRLIVVGGICFRLREVKFFG